MEEIKSTIKKLSDEEFDWLLTEVSDNKQSKPYIVLQTLRDKNLSDNEMMMFLDVNPSTFYTLKSRLRTKIASVLAKKIENPISILREEVSRVSAFLYGNNKSVAIRALKELEKQLVHYDLSHEIIHVYKALAYLHLYQEEHSHYLNLYNKHVAFSLAVDKAENIYYQFIYKMGNYLLTYSPDDLELVKHSRRELSNICELYESHRLFVMNNIVRIYYLCLIPDFKNRLRDKELEFEAILKEVQQIFDRYPIDTFYLNIKFVVNHLFFIYYQKVNNTIRAEHYFNKMSPSLPELSDKHILSFHVVLNLQSRMQMYLTTQNEKYLYDELEEIENRFEVDDNEHFQNLNYKKLLAIARYYKNDFKGASRILNELRNRFNLKVYLYSDIDHKLFLTLLYALQGEDNLCSQLINSVKRQVKDQEKDWGQVKVFSKIITTSFKNGSQSQKQQKIKRLLTEMRETEQDVPGFLSYIRNDDELSRLLSLN